MLDTVTVPLVLLMLTPVPVVIVYVPPVVPLRVTVVVTLFDVGRQIWLVV